jgi:hypothetical protein
MTYRSNETALNDYELSIEIEEYEFRKELDVENIYFDCDFLTQHFKTKLINYIISNTNEWICCECQDVGGFQDFLGAYHQRLNLFLIPQKKWFSKSVIVCQVLGLSGQYPLVRVSSSQVIKSKPLYNVVNNVGILQWTKKLKNINW